MRAFWFTSRVVFLNCLQSKALSKNYLTDSNQSYMLNNWKKVCINSSLIFNGWNILYAALPFSKGIPCPIPSGRSRTFKSIESCRDFLSIY